MDRHHLSRKGWLPRTEFAELEERREQHEALIDRRDAVHAERHVLAEKFAAEDRAHADALELAFRDSTSPPRDARTSTEKRKKALADADARSSAASRVAFEYALDVLDWLRGPVPADKPHLDAQALKAPPEGEAAKLLSSLHDDERALLDSIAEARRAMDEADRKLRGYQPLKVWLARNGNASTSLLMPGGDLGPLPERHSPMSKPADAATPADWPQGWMTGMPREDTYENTEDASRDTAISDEDGGFETDPFELEKTTAGSAGWSIPFETEKTR